MPQAKANYRISTMDTVRQPETSVYPASTTMRKNKTASRFHNGASRGRTRPLDPLNHSMQQIGRSAPFQPANMYGTTQTSNDSVERTPPQKSRSKFPPRPPKQSHSQFAQSQNQLAPSVSAQKPRNKFIPQIQDMNMNQTQSLEHPTLDYTEHGGRTKSKGRQRKNNTRGRSTQYGNMGGSIMSN